MESSTQVLRRLLDERGVKWWQSANTLGCVFTRWYSPLFGDEVCAMENGEEGLVLFDHFVTPEQAVEATLGSGVDSMTDAELADHGLVRLPTDADGVPIHVGDVLTDGEYTFRVDELAAFGDGSWSIRNEDGNAWAACDVTHHHEPTVEDVLLEFTDEVWNRCCEGATASDSGIDELVAECAAKLRLAGEDA